MANLIEVVAFYEGADKETYEAMSTGYSHFTWKIGDNEAQCNMGQMSIAELNDLLSGWGDELDEDEIRELYSLSAGEQAEITRGRGLTYEITVVDTTITGEKKKLGSKIRESRVAIEELQNLSHFCHTNEEQAELDAAIKALNIEIQQWRGSRLIAEGAQNVR